MRTLAYINLALGLVFTACCFYQAVYAALRLRGRKRSPRAQKLCRYAVLIAARNEENVIGQLLDSIREQDYPADLVDVYVVADNCTDSTARVAREHGATVYERQNKLQVGKGYALQFLLEHIREDRIGAPHDGYFVFDADNLLDPRYITEMNKVFSGGSRVVTGYRNSKNFGDNWITAGYGLFFLRECEYLNCPRDRLGVGCAVSGTGFVFAHSLLEELGGWEYHLLTEDLEFSADMMVRGENVAYCGEAILYDEQPRDFKQSVTQRSRWIKGYLQVMGKYGWDLVRTLAGSGRFGCYDMLMNTIPATVLTVTGLLLNGAMLVLGMVMAPRELGMCLLSAGMAVCSTYLVLYVMGLLTLMTEWKRIRCSARKKALYSFTFPLFILSFAVALAPALLGSVGWEPIRHTSAVSIGDLKD